MVDEANWLTLEDDLSDIEIKPGTFDAVLCLGNSFAHLPDFEGDQSKQRLAIDNFIKMAKPGTSYYNRCTNWLNCGPDQVIFGCSYDFRDVISYVQSCA